jgi:DNA-binding response OmpR family regulator
MSAHPNLEGRTILVVDAQDGYEVAAGINRLHCRAEVVSTMRSAMESIQAGVPHAVIVEDELPDGGGAELCRQTKANSRTVIPFIMVSRHEMPERVTEPCGIDVVLRKPLDVVTFAEILVLLLQKSEQVRVPVRKVPLTQPVLASLSKAAKKSRLKPRRLANRKRQHTAQINSVIPNPEVDRLLQVSADRSVVLIVCGERVIAEALRIIISMAGRYCAATAHSGFEAVERARELQPWTVLMFLSDTILDFGDVSTLRNEQPDSNLLISVSRERKEEAELLGFWNDEMLPFPFPLTI